MRNKMLAAAAIAMVTLGALSCDHSPTMPHLDQLALDVVSGDGQTAIVGTQLAPLIVKVTSGGNPVALQVLNFRVVSGSGSVYGGTELTDNDGIAQELWTLGTNASQPQKVEVRAVESSTGAEKVFGTFSATALPDRADSLVVAAGNSQTAVAGNALAIPPAVEVTDRYGNPINGISVTFSVATGGGSVIAPTVVNTGANGMAAVGGWTLGTTAGANSLTAQTAGLGGSPVTFTATATSGTAARLVATTLQFSGQVGTVLAPAPVLRAVDANGNGVANVAVTFTVLTGGGSLDGVTSLTTLTDSMGATAVTWTLGTTVTPNTIQATSQGMQGSPIVFTATTTPGPATQIAVSGGNNQSATVNTAVTTAPSVIVRDQFNNPVSGVAVTFAVVTGGGSLTGGGQTTNAAGIAAVGSWTLGQAAGPNTLTATSTGLTGSPVTFTAAGSAGAATQIAKNAGDNQSANVNMAVATPPSVIVRDQFNNPVSGVAVTFAVATGGGSLTGGSQTTNVAGIATVGSWTLGLAAGPNTLTATSTGLTGSPATFTATAIGCHDCWTTKASMPTPRYALGTAAIDGILYAVGGYTNGGNTVLATVEAYDPATNTWTTKASMPTARAYLGVAAVNGILYAVGGEVSYAGAGLTTLEAYDPTTDTWTTKASMPTARNFLGVGVVNGKLFAVGGAVSGVGMATVEAYDPATDSWATKASTPDPRYYLGADTVSGILYAVGGVGPSARVDAYNAATDTWTNVASLTTPVSNLAVAADNGILYAIGGVGHSTNVATVEAYDPTTNVWTTKAPMLNVLSSAGASVIGGILYTVGGSDNSLTSSGTVQAYHP